MLGIKLGRDVEERFERFVRRHGQRKSDVGRAAIIEYLNRHDDDAEIERDIALIAALEGDDFQRKDELDALETQVGAVIKSLD